MRVTPVRTAKITADSGSIFDVLDKSLKELSQKSVVAVASKVIAICEGRIVPAEQADIDDLVKQEADYYLPSSLSKYGFSFSMIYNTLIPRAGIDESNGNGNYVLWPKNPQKSANDIRAYLKKRFGLKQLGVIITDSTCLPLRWGTVGIVLSHSGFRPLNNYVGQPDLFGRPFKVSRAGVATGLGSAAVLVMGEGAEQTPLAIIEDVPFIEFQDRDPTPEDIAELLVPPDEDLYAPFLNSLKWHRGGRK